MDCLAERERVSPAIKIAKTLYKTPALIAHRVRCGKPNCRCATGEGHGPYHFLLWRQSGKQRRRYVRQSEVEAVRTVIERRQRHDRETRRLVAESLADWRGLKRWLKELDAGRWP
jgi:hypothetical protein